MDFRQQSFQQVCKIFNLRVLMNTKSQNMFVNEETELDDCFRTSSFLILQIFSSHMSKTHFASPVVFFEAICFS